jgi:phage tail sheath protein FI
MPVTPTYPGLYIEELPSAAHTITAAPTSIAVFIGYTHPFKTASFGMPVPVDDFTDYETYFGGLFASPSIPTDLPYAVQQFFLNGGAQAYVVGLQPSASSKEGGQTVQTVPFAAPTSQAAGAGALPNVLFTGLVLTDQADLTVTITNVMNDPVQGDPKTVAAAQSTIADLTIAYGGGAAETYRKVSLNPQIPGTSGAAAKANPNYIETRINGVSSLVTVAPPPASGTVAGTGFVYGQFPAPSPAPPALPAPVILTLTYPAALQTALGNSDTSVFSAPDYTNVFAAEGPLDKLAIFNLMIIPGVADFGVLSEAVAFCERKRAFLIMDPPANAVADGIATTSAPLIEDQVFATSTNAALYFPYVQATDALTGASVPLAPSGLVAGIYAKIDNSRGVWKAPAGLETTLGTASGVVHPITDARAGVLNALGINAIRQFANLQPVVFGARTLASTNSAFQQWKYVPVRRMALFLEQTLLANLGWVVFEPNDTPLWVAITTSVSAFMLTLFQQGAFQGTTPSQAFLVKCDSSTTTQQDIDNGVVNILVGFAPLKPAEFVVIQITQLAGQSS